MAWPGRDIEVGVYAQRMVSDIRYVQLTAMTCEDCETGAIVIDGNGYEFQLDGVPRSFADGQMGRDIAALGLNVSGDGVIFDSEFGEPVDSGGTSLTSALSLTLSGTAICIYPRTGYTEIGACS